MFKSYQASAGSGKTTHLVAEYLSICFEAISHDYIDEFKHILAITFTNNATTEMKERIIHTLSHFAFTDDYSALSSSHQAILKMIIHNLNNHKKWDHPMLKASSFLLLKEILYNYNDFSISTIDSFFQRIVRSFAIELGLNMNFNLEIDQSEFYSQTIDLLLNKISKQEYNHDFSLSKQIMTIVDHNLNDFGKSRLEPELRSFLGIMHSEEAYYPMKSLENVDRQEFRKWCSTLKQKRDQAKKELLTIAEEGDLLIKNSGIEPDFFYQKKKGPYYWFEKLKSNPSKLPGCYMKDAIEKGTVLSKPFPSFDSNKVFELYKMATARHQYYITLKTLCENLNTFTLIFDLKEILFNIKTYDNLFFLSDTNALINDEIQESDTPFIFEKIGNRYRHFLIDEFQDTSKMQWENLLPLVKNAISGGFPQTGKTILFGDTKQAIYRFRAGDASLFQELSTPEGFKKAMSWNIEEQADFQRESLNTNYRSAKAIIDFNNQFFTLLKGITNKEELIFSKAPLYYADVIQQKPEHSDKKGFVSIRFKTEDDGEDYLEQEVLHAVHDALAQNFNYQDIAILSRGRENSARYAQYLSQHGIPVISSDSLLLYASEEVRVLIAALQYLLDPKHDIAKTVIYNYLHKKYRSESSANIDFICTKSRPFREILDEYSIHFNSKKLLNLPLYTLTKELIILFHLQSANAYLTTFLDKILDFSSNKNPSISLFLDWWEEKKETLSLSAPKNHNAITVTTVHKSKGLQYPVVIFPFTRYISRNTKSTIWHKTEDEAVPYSPVKLSKSAEGTFLEESYTEEYAMSRLDDLNILYVAHTRPISCFYIITEGRDKGNYAKYLTLLIRQLTEEESNHYCFGERDFNVKREIITDKDEILPTLSFSDFTPTGAKLLYSKITTPTPQQQAGVTIHNYLAQLEYFPQTDEEINELIIDMDEENTAKIRKVMRQIIHDPELAPCFAPEVTTWREKTIVNTDGKLLRPDRMVQLGQKIILIDYKTGKKKEADQQQIQQYIEIIKAMGYKNVEGKAIYINE